MGQKVNPIGMRTGIIKDWQSVWYADKDFGKYLVQDDKIRKLVKSKKTFDAAISKVLINRTASKVTVLIKSAKPGVIIGKNGQKIQELTRAIEKIVNVDKKTKIFVQVSVEEIKRIELDAQLVAEQIAKQLEDRISFRRAMKNAMTRTMKARARGIKTAVSGRLGGADMARTEHYHEGTIPLQTIRADIDYGFAEADTTFGKLGVKVWIYKGEILPTKVNKEGGTK